MVQRLKIVKNSTLQMLTWGVFHPRQYSSANWAR